MNFIKSLWDDKHKKKWRITNVIRYKGFKEKIFFFKEK